MRRDYIGAEEGLPGRPTSVWLHAAPSRGYGTQTGRETADAVVVGGGLVGIVTAHLLARSGQRVVLLESRAVLGDVTGHTTAKATIQHGPIYHELRERHGELAALTYAEANLGGLNRLVSLVNEHGIECGLRRVDSYLFAENDEGLRTLLREAEAASALDLPVEYVESIPADMPAVGALRLPHQAAFDPVAFGLALLEATPELTVYERSRALDIRDAEDGRVEVVTEGGAIAAWNVVMATHFPFWDRGAYFSRLYQIRTYALGLRLRGEVPRDMFYPVDTGVSLRRYDGPDGALAIVSGEHHKAGQGGDERERYRALERDARERLPVESVEFHWSTQDNHTADGIPFVGRSPGAERVYLATGFHAWGMTNSFAAANLLSDLVNGRDNPTAALFDARRVDLGKSAAKMVSENLNVVKRYAADRIAGRRRDACDIPPGEGAAIEHNGRYVAARREPDGRFRVVDARCTHLNCVVTWNEAEKTWDCPCHGSRYSADGEPIHGPALHHLSPAESAADRPTCEGAS